jgi:hypothetical protein
MATISQPTSNPTNKLTSAVLATAAVAVLKAVINFFFPDFGSEEMWLALMPVAAYVAGYVIKDAPNIEVTQQVVATDTLVVEKADA